MNPIGIIVLTDLATPDVTDMRVVVSSIVAYGNDSRRHGDDFRTYFGYLDLVGGHTKLVTESAEEIEEKLIELSKFMQEQAEAEREAQAEADAAYQETISKALGLDESFTLDLQHTLAAE